ncbi:MAG: cytochrome P450 [Flavobacteriales bacterium]
MKAQKIPLLNKWDFIKWFPTFYRNHLNGVVKLLNTEGDIINFRLTKKKGLILVNHPDYIQHILKTNQENYSRKRVMRPLYSFLGDGLFASEGKLWEQQHQLLKPTFHDKFVKDYFDTISFETSVLIEEWKEKSKQNISCDVEFDVNILMLRILLKTQLSSAIDVDYREIIRCLRLILKSSSYKQQFIKITKGRLRKLFLMKAISNDPAKEALQTLENIVANIRKIGAEKPETMGLALQTLEQAKASGFISDKQVRDEIMNFIFAGFDTTASALTWSLYCYAKNDHWSKQVNNEISDVLQGKIPEMQNIAEMPLTKMFIQEAMRLYPPVWSLLRLSHQDDTINGYHFPKDSLVMICIYAMHRHPQFWDNPDVFNPERFYPENMKGKAFVYIPFGQGKRACVGKPLAMAELQIIFPLLLQHFDFELIDKKEPIINPDVIIKPKKPLMMKLKYKK